MITFDDVKAALAAGDPHTAMDRLIRSELAAGRRTADIFTELFPTAKRARETLGLSRDANAALIGTLDALTGDCDPDQCYQDPPDAVPPAADDVARFPRGVSVPQSTEEMRQPSPS